MDVHCSGWFLYILVSAKCKSRKRKVKRKKMPRLGQIVCIRVGEGGSGRPKEASL